ncbi:MAG: LuxR C-terminal-related transcriptional regulator [Caldilineaceae bacterium]
MLQDPYQARRLLNLLPTAQLMRQPRLILERCRLTFLFDEGDLEQYVAQADTALSAMPVSDAEYPRLQAEYLVYRGAALFRRQSYADMAETLAQALTSVHLLDDFMAASLYFLHMHMSFAQGRETEAIKMGEQALSTHTRARFGAGVVSLQREMVKWAMRRGNIAEANRRLQEMYGDRAYDGSMSLREYALTYLYAAENSYWQDDLATARDYQQAMLSLAQTLQDDQLICMGQFLAWAYADDLHKHEDAWLALTAFSPVFVARSLRAQAIDVAIRSLVAMGFPDKAWQLALELGLLSETPHPQQSERVLTAYSLACLSRGEDLEALTSLLEDALAHRRQTGHRVGELQLLAIMAWQQLQLRGELAATAVLVEAHKLAQQTGYVRVLRDIPVLAPLLERVRALGDGDGDTLGETVSLTDQEQQVLTLLDADHTYPEIAEKLVISINTVRTHMRNLYRKLGVHRRAQALDAARANGLLSKR